MDLDGHESHGEHIRHQGLNLPKWEREAWTDVE